MKKKIYLVIGLFLILFGTVIYNQVNTTSANSEGVKYEIYGTIRNEGKGWYLIQDDRHNSKNIRSVTSDGRRILINHNIGAKKVGTFIVTVDETMASEGYTVGVTGGVGSSGIYIYDKNHVAIDPMKYKNASGNIWIYGILN